MVCFISPAKQETWIESELEKRFRGITINPHLMIITPPRWGGLKVNIQFFSYSYRLAKPSKPIFFPKVEKSEAIWRFPGQKKLAIIQALEGPNPKISSPCHQLSGKKKLGQLDFSMGGKLRFREGGRKECKICPKVPRNGTKFQDFISWARNELFGHFPGSK